MYKSEQLALSLKHLIDSGFWTAHDKLPSLRQQANTSGFSLMTVMNAYQELEAQGLIYSRPKLGYFVAEALVTGNSAKTIVLNDKIEINSSVFRYLKSIQSEQIIPFGSAFPNSQLLYSTQLMQILAKQAKYRNNYAQTPSLPPGHLELRKQIAQRYSMQGIQTDPSDIVITSGGLDALNLSLKTLTQAGDYILLQETIFYGAWQAAEHLGLKVITIPEHPEYGLDLEAFEDAVTRYPIKVCLLMLNSHNPVGFTVSDEIKFKLAQLLAKHQIYMIEDDVYEELYYGHKKPLCMKYFDQHNLVLHCSSFSKTLGAGFRIGWVYAGKFSEHIQHLQLMSTISVNSLIQNALAEYLSHRYYEKHLKALRNTLKRLKNQYYQYFLSNLSDDYIIKPYPSGYFLWIKLPTSLNSDRVYQHLLQKNISVAPITLFYGIEKQKDHIRINCSFEITPEIEHALDQIIQSLKM